MSDFSTFAKYHTKEEAAEVAELFKQQGIPYLLEHERNLLDKIYVGESLDPFFEIKIPAANFEQANTVLLDRAKKQLHDINPDYYLFSFSNEELAAVTANPGEWNHFDQALAQKLLAERKVEMPLSQSAVKAVKTYMPGRLELPWIITGYLLSVLFVMAGIIIGLITLTAYRTLPDGKKVPLYDKGTHFHAKLFLVIGVVRALFFVVRIIFLIND